MRRAVVVIAISAISAISAITPSMRAAAADPTTTDSSTADKLFQEGRQLLADGKTDEACDRFEKSNVKDPRAVGTLLNLGLCNERRGKVATALRYFQQAFDHASAANLPGQRQAAQEQIAALTPQIPQIIVERKTGPLPGEKLLVDDQVVPLDRREIAVDPGRRAITLTAPGRLPYQTSIVVAPSDRKVVVLPELAIPGTTTIIRASSTRRIGKIITAAGGAVTVGAIVIAGVAKHRYDLQTGGDDPACGGSHGSLADGTLICTSYGQSRVDSARRLGTYATVAGGVGLAAVATGLVLWLTSPGDEVGPAVTPAVTTTSVGVSLSMTW